MLLKKAHLSPRDVLRTKEDSYKQLGLARAALTDDELIEAMVKYPDLIQRPLVEQGEKALLARPAEKVSELLRH
jgi:arsenate reductase